MKYFGLTLISLVLFSCSSPIENNLTLEKNTIKDTLSINEVASTNDTLFFNLHNQEILYIKSENIIIFSDSNGIYLSDTIQGLDFEEIIFEDKDMNEFSDLVFKGHENIAIEYIYCYDPNVKLFKKITDHELHGWPKRLYPEANLYYSYSPDGCTWNNWESTLFKITNYQIEYLKCIYLDNCTEGSESEDGVTFNLYKWNGKKFKLILTDSSELFKEAATWGLDNNGLEEYWKKQEKQ